MKGAGPAEVYVEKDRGIYDAMNQALSRARGRYVHFLNSGDLYVSRSVLRQVWAAAQGAGMPELVVCHINNLDQNTVIACPPHLSQFYLFRRCLCHQAVFFRRDLFERLGAFDSSFWLKADHDFILRCLQRSKCTVFIIPEALVDYEGGGISDAKHMKGVLDRESKEVHRRHFHQPQRTFLWLVRELTLWRVRRWALEEQSRSQHARIYHRLAAFLNRL